VGQAAKAMESTPSAARGFYAGAKKRQGITVIAAERVSLVGATGGRQGTYTIGDHMPAAWSQRRK
jgi:hypothetical protein